MTFTLITTSVVNGTAPPPQNFSLMMEQSQATMGHDSYIHATTWTTWVEVIIILNIIELARLLLRDILPDIIDPGWKKLWMHASQAPRQV